MDEPLKYPPYCDIANPAVAAHRGASRRYTENSMAAFKEAINMAMENPEIRFFLEMDVRATRDGKLVLMHDANVARTTYGHGFIEEMRLADVQHLPMKSVADINGAAAVCYDRVAQPFFKITNQDLHVPTLDEVFDVVKQANRVRGAIGSPVGIALHIKPRAMNHWLADWTEPVAGVISTVLDTVGMHQWAYEVIGPTPSIPLLSALLNHHIPSDQTLPILTFSTTGAIGKRDLNALWDQLSPEVKLAMMHQPAKHTSGAPYIANTFAKAMALNRPHQVSFAEISSADPAMNILQKMADSFKIFWLIGSLAPETKAQMQTKPLGIPILTNMTILDTVRDIKDATAAHATLVATNYPEHAIQAFRDNTRFNETHPQATMIANHPSLNTFTQRESQRRLQSATTCMNP